MDLPLFGPVPGLLELTIILFLVVTIVVPALWICVQLLRDGYTRLTGGDTTANVFAQRLGAALIDSIPAFLIGGALVSIIAQLSYQTVYSSPPDSDLTFVGFAIAMIGYTAYFLGFELAWDGQTPGKRLLNVRVTTPEHTPASQRALVIRNLIRPLDVFLFYPIVVLVIAISNQNQRLGDFAANTIVSHTTVVVDTTPEHHPTPAQPR